MGPNIHATSSRINAPCQIYDFALSLISYLYAIANHDFISITANFCQSYSSMRIFQFDSEGAFGSDINGT